ncbi:histidine--tRNA ligase [Futiania mangrovi]|uniref:histidine--tRNA ligase n=1 Tax=Futiania mangrovi TaxID=2959716 RepID=UPI0022AFE200|nr:histidine--tRNA ligase [Futiania mangrovii]
MPKITDQEETRPQARLPRGFRDIPAGDVRARGAMLATIREVYERHGFSALETPAIEYLDALGKYLPDVDRPMGGVFGFQDEDGDWLALRYDLTAPLARMVAMAGDRLTKPYRRYQVGPVYRNEKPGPGRFCEFFQFDADTVGTPVMAADAELTMMVSATFEALGIPRGDYVVRVNNRKVLSGVLEAIGLGEDGDAAQRGTVLRAIDKLDRLGADGVRLLLGKGRRDESGDFTQGAHLGEAQIGTVLAFVAAGAGTNAETLQKLRDLVGGSAVGAEGVAELEEIAALVDAAGFAEDRILIDPSVVRGLAYYTGPVFEGALTFPVQNERGETVQFGAVAGGGRYDDLVKRFTGQEVPATGISIGVDRLLTALVSRGLVRTDSEDGPVLVLVLDRGEIARAQAMTAELRAAGIRAEMYLGTSGMRAQLKYADRRTAPIAVIEGTDEREKGEITLKDLKLGAELAKSIESHDKWKEHPSQVTVPRGDLVASVRQMLAAQAARQEG